LPHLRPFAFVASASEVHVGLGGREATPRGDGSGPALLGIVCTLPPLQHESARLVTQGTPVLRVGTRPRTAWQTMSAPIRAS